MVAPAPLDLAGDTSAQLTIRSTAADTKTQVVLSVSDGKTTYTSKASQRVTGKPQALTFPLAVADLELVDGPRVALAEVLKHVATIGFKLTSDGSTYNETILFDDLAVAR